MSVLLRSVVKTPDPIFIVDKEDRVESTRFYIHFLEVLVWCIWGDLLDIRLLCKLVV